MMELDSTSGGVFVGRDEEIRTLLDALAGARAGEGRLLLVVGDGGIGKTRILEELARRADAAGSRVLWARSPEQSGVPSYWQWAQILREHAERSAPEVLGAQLGDAVVDVARIAPAVGARLGLTPPQSTADSEHSRFRLFEGVATLLRAAARDDVVVLLFDDLHWADASSLALLGFVAGELRRERVLLVGALREGEMRRTPEAMRALARLGHRIPLRGLARDDVARLVAAALPTPPTDEIVADLYDTTDGNPFFLGEVVSGLAAMVGTGGDASRVPMPVPESVRIALRRRLEPLEEERTLLDVACVVGREFELAIVARAGDVEPAAALDRLGPALADGVVAEIPHAPGRFRFSHALVRETLYGDLLPGARMQGHRRVALALEALHANDDDPPYRALAHHFFQAAPLGEGAKAVRYAQRSAGRATRLAAHEEAVAQYERALTICTLLPDAEAVRTRLLVRLGYARWRVGDERGAREALGRAVECARARDDVTVLAMAAIGFGAVVGLTGGVDEAAVRMLEDLLARLPADAHLLRCHATALLSQKLYFAADRARGIALAAEALALARRLGDPLALGSALIAQHTALWDADHVSARPALAAEALAAAREGGEVTIAVEARMLAALDALELGDVATATTLFDQYAAEAAAAGFTRSVAHAWATRAMRAILAGDLDEAERLAARGPEIRGRDDLNNAAQFQAVQLFTIERERGRLAALEPVVETLVRAHPLLPIWRAGLALLYADAGRTEEARRELAFLAGQGFRDLRRDCNWLPIAAICAEVASLVDARDTAATLYELLRPYGRLWTVLGTAIACWGSVERSLGLLAAGLDRAADAATHLDRALATHASAGAVVLLAHTQLDRAAVARTLGDEERARTLVAEARAIAAERGLPRVAARVAAAEGNPRPARPLGREPARLGEPAPTAVAVLRREGEYWTAALGPENIRVKDAKGLAYLATLLRHPGREFHVLDLTAADPVDAPLDAGAAMQTGLRPGDGGDAGELLDSAARNAYRRRIAEIERELVEAREGMADDRIVDLERERDFLAAELARAVGLGGRSRQAASPAERARQNVSRAVLGIVRRIAEACPLLGAHLVASVRTGTFCSYMPPADVALAWDVR